MAYTPFYAGGWKDYPNTSTPITSAALNRIEKGIEDCGRQGNANELAIAANAEAIRTLESGIQLGSISITQLLLMAHPIGSIYSSTAATSPADLFGGTWERIKGRFIWGIEDGETAGTTGGEKTHTLTVSEMPEHYHYYNSYANGFPTQVEGTERYRTAVRDNINTTDSVAGTQTNVAGGGQAHNNMPPYYGAYVWRRTA